MDVRRPWRIAPRPERDQQPQRRRLGNELERWRKLGTQQPGVRTEPDTRRQGEIARGFQPTDAVGVQEGLFRRPDNPQAGLLDVGARRARQFGDAVRELPESDRSKISALGRVMQRRNLKPQNIIELARQQDQGLLSELRGEVDTELEKDKPRRIAEQASQLGVGQSDYTRWQDAHDKVIASLTAEQREQLAQLGYNPLLGRSDDSNRAADPQYGDPERRTLLMPETFSGEVDETLLRHELAHHLIGAEGDPNTRTGREHELISNLEGVDTESLSPQDRVSFMSGTQPGADEQELQRLREIINTAPFGSPEFTQATNRIQELTEGASGGPADLPVGLAKVASQVDRESRRGAAPVTEPIGEAVGTGLATAATSFAQPARVVGEELDIPGLRSIPSLTETEEAVRGPSRTLGGEILNPVNLIPIPFVDPAIARLLGLAGRAGARLTRPALAALARRAERRALETAEPAVREGLQQFADDARIAVELPDAGQPALGEPDVSGFPARDVPDAGVPGRSLGPGVQESPPVPRAGVVDEAIPERAPEPAQIVDDFEAIPSEAIAEEGADELARIGGGGDMLATSLRPFEQVYSETEIARSPILRHLVSSTGINPAATQQQPVARAVTAYYRQLAAGEQLTNVATQQAFDVHARRFTGSIPLNINDEGRVILTDGTRVHWNDVLSNDRFTGRLTPEQVALRDDVRRLVDEIEFQRVQAGLKPRATRGPDAANPDGWFYVPRQVEEVRGLSIDRASNPALRRFYEEAEEGLAAGVRYSTDPRQVVSLHVRNAYREIAQKQFSDFLDQELISATPKQLIPEATLKQMSDAVTNRLAAERSLRNLQAQRLRTQVGRTQEPTADLPRGTRAAEQQVRQARGPQRARVEGNIKAAQRELNSAMQQYNKAKTRYSAALKAARNKRVGPGHLFGRSENEIEIGQWRNRFFTREDAELLNTELGAFVRDPRNLNIVARGFKNLGDSMRFLSAVGDFAAPFIQGLPLAGRNPVAWARSTARHYQAWFDPTVQARWIRDNADVMQEMASYNIPVGDVEFFTAIREGGAPAAINIGEIIERLPKGRMARNAWKGLSKQSFGRFQSSYDAFLTMARGELWKGMKPKWQGSLDDLAAHTRNMTGGLDSRALGVGPSQRGFEATWMAFSPRLVRSTVTLMADALGVSGRDRAFAAWRALGPLMAGTAGMYVLTGKLLDKSDEEIIDGLNPLSGKRFLSHEINGDWVGVGGQIRGVMQGIAKSGAVINRSLDDPQELGAFLALDQFENPLLSFALSRSAPATRVAQSIIELYTGEDALPFEDIDSLPDLIRHTGKSALPFAVQGWLEGEQALTTALALVGARTSPETNREAFDRLYQEKHGTPPAPGVSPRTLDPELSRQAGYSETTGFQTEREQLLEGETRFLADAARIAIENPHEAMEQFESELSDYFRVRSGVTEALVAELGLPEREQELATQYYELDPRDRRDPTTGQPDWDYFESRRERILQQIAGVDPNAAQRLREGSGQQFSDPDLQRAYEANRSLKDGLDAYYETESDGREDFRIRNPEIDAQLYLLGRVSRVVTRNGLQAVADLSQQLFGHEVEASMGESSGRPRRREPVRR